MFTEHRGCDDLGQCINQIDFGWIIIGRYGYELTLGIKVGVCNQQRSCHMYSVTLVCTECVHVY